MTALSFAGLTLAAELFKDPAPPIVQRPAAVPAPSPKATPDVRVHAKPKPLPPNAVTHDWVSFLGPTHNAISAETKLLREWQNGAPTSCHGKCGGSRV